MPVLLGIGALISAIVTFFTTATAGFLAWLAQRSVWNTLYLLGMVTLLGAFVVFVNDAISNVLSILQGYDLGWFAYGILPDDTDAILAISLSAEAGRWLHDQAQSALNRKFHG